jgi:hypothetical protein
MSAWLDKLKQELMERHRMQQLLEPEKFKKENEKLAKGIRDIPVQKFITHVQYIEKELMPAIEKRRGKDAPELKFFEEVCRSLVWAVILCDRYDYLEMKVTGLRLENTILRDNLALHEKELQKFGALEDIFFTDFLDRYADAVKSRAEGLLNKKKPE